MKDWPISVKATCGIKILNHSQLCEVAKCVVTLAVNSPLRTEVASTYITTTPGWAASDSCDSVFARTFVHCLARLPSVLLWFPNLLYTCVELERDQVFCLKKQRYISPWAGSLVGDKVRKGHNKAKREGSGFSYDSFARRLLFVFGFAFSSYPDQNSCSQANVASNIPARTVSKLQLTVHVLWQKPDQFMTGNLGSWRTGPAFWD